MNFSTLIGASFGPQARPFASAFGGTGPGVATIMPAADVGVRSKATLVDGAVGPEQPIRLRQNKRPVADWVRRRMECRSRMPVLCHCLATASYNPARQPIT